MKQKRLLTFIALALTGISIAAPQIDSARVDAMLEQFGNTEQNQLPPDARQQIEKTLAATDILKAEALKQGLDKQPAVQARWKNLEAQFYASQYEEHLVKTVSVSDSEALAAYGNLTRIVKLAQVRFATADEARAAQQLLLKGLSFEKLMERYPNPDQPTMQEPLPIGRLPVEIANIVGNMQKGDVSREPVAYQNEF